VLEYQRLTQDYSQQVSCQIQLAHFAPTLRPPAQTLDNKLFTNYLLLYRYLLIFILFGKIIWLKIKFIILP